MARGERTSGFPTLAAAVAAGFEPVDCNSERVRRLVSGGTFLTARVEGRGIGGPARVIAARVFPPGRAAEPSA